MKKSNAGSAIVIGMGLTVLIMLTAIVILDYIVPFARSTSGGENSSNAYYQSFAGVEESLYKIKLDTNSGNFKSYNDELQANSVNHKKDMGYTINATGSGVPLTGSGNSEFDKNYNIIGQGYPLQLKIFKDKMPSDLSNFKLKFRVPDFASGAALSLSGGSVITWILTSEDDSLNADSSSGSNLFSVSDVADSRTNPTQKIINTKTGMDLSGSGRTFEDFYDANCQSTGCTLKLNVISKLKTTGGVEIPYLEYQINTNNNNFPQQYTTIDASGKSYGYKQELKARVGQKTTAEGFDFTLFQ